MASRLVRMLKAVVQLGFSQSLNYLYYQFALKIGYFRFRTPSKSQNTRMANDLFKPDTYNFWPDSESIRSEESSLKTIKQANEILGGEFQLFGLTKAPIDLSPRSILQHWSLGRVPINGFEQLDIKFIWEPARFGWAVKLAQAYYLTNDDKYASCFCEKFTEFNKKNPLNLGPNWESAQEVALRLIALTISYDLMQKSKSLSQQQKLAILRSIADHANRISPTLSYAKAQNNNHLISEAVGLFTAGLFLPHHPHAKKWEHLGLKWFNFAIQNQITSNGEYVQHSNNYHRMLLTLALWMNTLLVNKDLIMGTESKAKLASAVNWLNSQFDQISGKVPNLGHNDGSNILPFSSTPYDDYMPILSAASRMFLEKPYAGSTGWEELSAWLGVPEKTFQKNKSTISVPYTITRIGDKKSWATLQAVHYGSRPAHADQLHVNLWHQGFNITLDPGTFQYNAPPPWDNGLARTLVHNTITINGRDQMERGGRFLWLDWAQAKIISQNKSMVCAEHYGYKKMNAIHRRTIKNLSNTEWEISDLIFSVKPSEKKIKVVLHWLLPNWPVKHKVGVFSFSAPFGIVTLQISIDPMPEPIKFNIYEQGVEVSGLAEEQPLFGWYSPTYGVKIPSYSILCSTEKSMPIAFTSKFTFS